MNKDLVRTANNTMIARADEIWVFGEISNGVLAEIKMKREQGHNVRYFKIIKGYPIGFRGSIGKTMPFEDPELEEYRYLLS